MAPKHKLTSAKHVHSDVGGVTAEIFTRGTEPYRKLVTGRQRKAVGRPVMIKAGMRAVEWESIRAEKPFYELCEVATPVHTMFAQPHLLRMTIAGRRERMDFVPDLQVTVDTGFALQIASGVPFVEAVRAWKPKINGSVSTMIIEVKDDADSRIENPDYQHKLRLAEQCYQALGWFFTTVVRSSDISHPKTDPAIYRLFLKRKTTLSPGDLTAVQNAFAIEPNVGWGEVVQALGGGPLGVRKACAMHVRRLISVDVSSAITDGSQVQRIQDGRPLFELPGSLPW